jgi:hypothetical protein
MKTFEPKYDKNGIPHYGRGEPYDGKEDDLQKASAHLLRYFPGIIALHPPNERGVRVDKLVLFKLKRMGAVWGASDWIIFTPKTGFIELKAKGGKLSPNEIDFLNRMSDAGFPVAVCWNIDAFEYLIKRHANNRKWHTD